ncbi:bacterioferritin [Roseovarius sp. A-2]|uniref:bacterioferritin n=1 Tax=Roseovarius sp. A-2 TaxID=1570360 RepID=UPI0009B506F3|nr:bacterioferritin [Roseovarius sp. A-2]GAW34897.1 bacterioferritin [Roseovarius sp. A-2]
MAQTTKTLENLQQAVSMELAAVSQYMLHILTAESWGLDKLAVKMRSEMLEELGHAEAYSRRMVFLGGSPELKSAKVPTAAKSLKAMFEADLADEKSSLDFYTTAASEADQARDIGTRDLFEQTALDEEGHMTWLKLQLTLLDRMGEPAFIAMQVKETEAD